MCRVTVKPVKLYSRNEEWKVDVRRTVAYRAECDCGWRGSGRKTVTLALQDRREHLAARAEQPEERSDGPPAPVVGAAELL